MHIYIPVNAEAFLIVLMVVGGLFALVLAGMLVGIITEQSDTKQHTRHFRKPKVKVDSFGMEEITMPKRK